MTVLPSTPVAQARARSLPRFAAVAVFVAACVACMYFPSVWGWNQNSRLALVMAVVNQGTLSIDAYHERPGTDTGDKSLHGGHYYSDKAIGTALIGLPAYWALHPLLERLADRPERQAGVARAVVTWAAVSLPVAAATLMLFAFAWRVSGERRAATLVAASGLLGTPAWPFGTVLFGHATCAALLLGAFVLTRWLREGVARPAATATAIGLMLGLAAVTEYPPAVVVAMLGVYLLVAVAGLPAGRRARCDVPAVVAGLLPIAALLAYNAVCFGSPWTLSYARIAGPEFVQVHERGVLGVALPHLDRLAYLTVHPVRGLFVQSPVLLAGLAGLVPMAMRPGWRLEAGLILAALLALLAINAGFPVWWGGRSFGARHLIPAVMLLCVPIAFLAPRWRWLVGALLALSIVQMAIPTITTPIPPDEALAAALAALGPGGWLPMAGTSPIWTDGLQALVAGHLRANLGTQAGLPPALSILVAALAIGVPLAAAAWAPSRGRRARRVPRAAGQAGRAGLSSSDTRAHEDTLR
jgi:hypothetical protein